MLFLLILSGCGLEKEEDNTLWVVTELSNSDGMNYQADVIANRMMEKYPGLEIKLDILPTDPGEREIKLKHLRTQIMSGKGPDVYLMPTGTELISDEPERDVNIPIEPLFSDVNQAMRLGTFLDISDYYVPDDALKQEVMEAGILDGKCLVLPLRFQVPVVYTRPDLCEEYGIPREVLESDFLTLARFILSLEDAETAAIGLKFPENEEILGGILDYKKGNVLVTSQQIQNYMQLYQSRQELAAISTQAMYDKVDWDRLSKIWEDYGFEGTLNLSTGEAYGAFSREEYDSSSIFQNSFWPLWGDITHENLNLLSQYLSQSYHWMTCGIPVYTGDLSDILETYGVTMASGLEFAVYPLRARDGAVMASVAYWGAVGSSCGNPDLAYEFLSQFLEEEFQWDIYRPRGNKEGGWWNYDREIQCMRLVEDSLPVRVVGCPAPLWDNLQYQVKTPGKNDSQMKILRAKITEEDIPSLLWEIDYAYFPVDIEESLSLAGALEKLNNPDGTPTDVNIEELAEEVYQNLWWHLAEG